MISADPQPLVSLIMPARQPRPDWFRAAVQSACAQRGVNVELIVVDDGSPEPVEALLGDVDQQRVRVLRVGHGGPSHARNAGLHGARGEFIRYVDADDLLEPDSTARLTALASAAPGAAIAYGATMNCDAEMRPQSVMRSALRGWIAEDCLLYRFDVRCMSMVFPRAVVDAVGEWDVSLRHCQDWDYVLRALEHAPVRDDPQIATYYRRHGGAQTAKLAQALEFEPLVVDRYFERHPEQRGTRLERRARAQLLRVRSELGPQLGLSRGARLRLLGEAFALDRSGTAAHVAHRSARSLRRMIR
jgi:hypothetical protein